MNRFSKELIESLTDAVEHAEGKHSGVRVQVIKVPQPPIGSKPQDHPPHSGTTA